MLVKNQWREFSSLGKIKFLYLSITLMILMFAQDVEALD